mgnify:CR=1 FL=1
MACGLALTVGACSPAHSASRIAFIGRARSLRDPLVLEDLTFKEARDTPAHPTLDLVAPTL